MVQKGLLELVGRSDSDWVDDSMTRQSVTGYHCDVQGLTMCHRSLKQTATSLNSCGAEFYADSACAGELWRFAELFKILHYNVTVRLEMDSDSAFYSAGNQEDSNILKSDVWQHSSGIEKNAYRWAEWTRRNNTADLERSLSTANSG